jgi:hypothetical protein
MSAYDDLVAQAHAALNECDHKIGVAKLAIEDLKQKIVGLHLERRKIAALIPTDTPRAAKPASAAASVTGGAFVCAECSRSFLSAQAISMHGTRAGHATGYVKGSAPAPVPVPVAGGTTAQAVLAAEELPAVEPVRTEAEVVADVLAYWDERIELLPLDRIAEIARIVGIPKSEVRSIVHANERAVA